MNPTNLTKQDLVEILQRICKQEEERINISVPDVVNEMKENILAIKSLKE